jgi:hypothetical protein
MSFVEWDKELDRIAGDLKSLSEMHAESRPSSDRPLVTRKLAIIQTQIDLERQIAQIRKLVERDHLVLPRERTLIHWATVYVERAEKLLAQRTKHQNRNLWLKLIRTRLLGPDRKADAEVDADDLVALAVRHTNLARNERYLREALTKLKAQQKDLVEQYEKLAVVEANNVASTSLFSRLGASPEDAAKSPVLKALQLFLDSAAAPLASRNRQYQADAASEAYQSATSGLLGMCRDLVLGRRRGDAQASPAKTADRFHHAMRQLDDLEAASRVAFERLRPKASKTAPILMQKAPKQAKTVRN